MKLWYYKETRTEKVLKKGEKDKYGNVMDADKTYTETTREKVFLTDKLFIGESIDLSWQIMSLPQDIEITIPYSVLQDKGVTEAAFEFVLEFSDGVLYQGIVVERQKNIYAGTITLSAEHIANELSHKRLPTNFSVIDKPLSDLYLSLEDLEDKQTGKKKPNPMYDVFNDGLWNYELDSTAEKTKITYLFSNQNKLQALTDVCKLTDNIFWRVSRTKERTIELGVFGKEQNFLIQEKDILGNNLTQTDDFRDIVNYGIYLTDKSDSGTTALTLRDVYNDKKLHDAKFPIVETGREINSERVYEYLDLIPFGSNNKGDYAVLDKEGIALEEGRVYEAAFTSNDVQPVAEKNKELTDEDRLQAAKTLYKQAIRKLKHSRRKIGYSFDVAEFPASINVGDKVRLAFVRKLLDADYKCTKYYRKMVKNGYFYISDIKETIHYQEKPTYSLTFEYQLYNNREV